MARAIGPKAPEFGPKQTRSLRPHDVGIGGGPPRGGGMGENRRNDTGLRGQKEATAAGNPRSSRGSEQHREIVDRESATFVGGNVKGQAADGPGKLGIGSYRPGKEPGHEEENRSSHGHDGKSGRYDRHEPHGGHDGHMHHLGKHGRHSSVEKYEHDGYEHTSEHR